MADEKGLSSYVLPAVISCGIGVLFVASTQSARNQQNSIDALPALEQRVTALEASRLATASSQTVMRRELSEVRTSLAQQLDRAALDDVLQQLRDAILAVEAQLNRRLTLEVKEPIYRELDGIRDSLDRLTSASDDNENKIENLSAIAARLEAISEKLQEQ